MKKVLITGADSYIGTSFESWAKRTGRGFAIDTIEVISDQWKDKDFSVYDAVLHVAAIVHVKEKEEALYQKVNCELAYEIALKAKEQGVKQFVFLSTMAVFETGENILTEHSRIRPATPYARSKYAAERKLRKLNSEHFNVAVVRPPFVYGYGCKGNYVRMRKFALKCPVVPQIKNSRSMLYIDNLSEFLCNCILSGEGGIFHPQNSEYVCVSDMIKRIRGANGKRTWLMPGFGWLISLLKRNRTINKVFGDLAYDKAMSRCKYEYGVVDFAQSIMKTEGKVHGQG